MHRGLLETLFISFVDASKCISHAIVHIVRILLLLNIQQTSGSDSKHFIFHKCSPTLEVKGRSFEYREYDNRSWEKSVFIIMFKADHP